MVFFSVVCWIILALKSAAWSVGILGVVYWFVNGFLNKAILTQKLLVDQFCNAKNKTDEKLESIPDNVVFYDDINKTMFESLLLSSKCTFARDSLICMETVKYELRCLRKVKNLWKALCVFLFVLFVFVSAVAENIDISLNNGLGKRLPRKIQENVDESKIQDRGLGGVGSTIRGQKDYDSQEESVLFRPYDGGLFYDKRSPYSGYDGSWGERVFEVGGSWKLRDLREGVSKELE